MTKLIHKASVAAILTVFLSAFSVAAPSLLSPADSAAGVSQSPALNAAELTPGASAQYHFQVNTVSDMTSPLYSFDQTAAQSFAGQGAFSGQNTFIVAGSSDAYSNVSTATFAFYSNDAKLSPDTQYYWRVRAKPSGGAYGAWSPVVSFTTGRFAVQNPANHAAITGVNLFGATSAGLASIGFSIAENNITNGVSVNGGAYNTADWIFVKFSTQAGAEGTWNHATLTGGSVGAGATLTTASDNKGVFLDHTAGAAYWTAAATVTWNTAADGVFDSTAVVKVFTISMVRVPTGSFIYNSGGISYGTFNSYGGDFQATVANAASLPTGAPAGWPNGYNSFYMGRYEVTQGQYADYLNTLGAAQATAHHFNGVTAGQMLYYYSLNSYGSRYVAWTPNAPKAVLPFSDAWSYLSWAGVRPPTEMEWEKAGRDINGDTRRFPWGETLPGNNIYLAPNEGVNFSIKYLNFDHSGSGTGQVADAGRYMSGDVYRTPAETGASPWGIADLAGNLAEYTFNCSYSSVPSNGNGTPAWPANWAGGWNLPPGGSSVGSAAVGFRGGSWANISTYFNGWYFAISGRGWASFTANNYYTDMGARAVRGP